MEDHCYLANPNPSTTSDESGLIARNNEVSRYELMNKKYKYKYINLERQRWEAHINSAAENNGKENLKRLMGQFTTQYHNACLEEQVSLAGVKGRSEDIFKQTLELSSQKQQGSGVLNVDISPIFESACQKLLSGSENSHASAVNSSRQFQIPMPDKVKLSTKAITSKDGRQIGMECEIVIDNPLLTSSHGVSNESEIAPNDHIIKDSRRFKRKNNSVCTENVDHIVKKSRGVTYKYCFKTPDDIDKKNSQILYCSCGLSSEDCSQMIVDIDKESEIAPDDQIIESSCGISSGNNTKQFVRTDTECDIAPGDYIIESSCRVCSKKCSEAKELVNIFSNIGMTYNLKANIFKLFPHKVACKKYEGSLSVCNECFSTLAEYERLNRKSRIVDDLFKKQVLSINTLSSHAANASCINKSSAIQTLGVKKPPGRPETTPGTLEHASQFGKVIDYDLVECNYCNFAFRVNTLEDHQRECTGKENASFAIEFKKPKAGKPKKKKWNVDTKTLMALVLGENKAKESGINAGIGVAGDKFSSGSKSISRPRFEEKPHQEKAVAGRVAEINPSTLVTKRPVQSGKKPASVDSSVKNACSSLPALFTLGLRDSSGRVDVSLSEGLNTSEVDNSRGALEIPLITSFKVSHGVAKDAIIGSKVPDLGIAPTIDKAFCYSGEPLVPLSKPHSKEQTPIPLILSEINNSVGLAVTLRPKRKYKTKKSIPLDASEVGDTVGLSENHPIVPRIKRKYTKRNKIPLAEEKIDKSVALSENQPVVFRTKRKYTKRNKVPLTDEEIDKSVGLSGNHPVVPKRKYTRKKNISLPCFECEKSFNSVKTLLQHKYSDHKDTQVPCKECGELFMSIESLEKHMVSHEVQLSSESTLNDCEMTAAFPELPAAEIADVRPSKKIMKNRETGLYFFLPAAPVTSDESSKVIVKDRATGLYLCQLCGKKYIYFRSATLHKFSVHKDLFTKCKICGAVFKQSCRLRRHMRLHKPKRDYLCDECGRGFTSISSLNVHQATHKDPAYICDTCGRKYKRMLVLKLHEERVHGRPVVRCKTTNQFKFACNTCGNRFNSETSLQTHKRKHKGLFPFKCTKCSSSFISEKSLRTHQATSRRCLYGEKHTSYSCKKCSKMFFTEKDYNRHSCLASNVKKVRPYKCNPNKSKKVPTCICEVCGKGFSYRSMLKLHVVRSHLDVRKFICSWPGCGKAFKKRGKLTEHERIHTGVRPYNCAHCPKAFRRRDNLMKHTRVHTGETPYRCDNCGRGFKNSYNWKYHRYHLKKPCVPQVVTQDVTQDDDSTRWEIVVDSR